MYESIRDFGGEGGREIKEVGTKYPKKCQQFAALTLVSFFPLFSV